MRRRQIKIQSKINQMINWWRPIFTVNQSKMIVVQVRRVPTWGQDFTCILPAKVIRNINNFYSSLFQSPLKISNNFGVFLPELTKFNRFYPLLNDPRSIIHLFGVQPIIVHMQCRHGHLDSDIYQFFHKPCELINLALDYHNMLGRVRQLSCWTSWKAVLPVPQPSVHW